MKRAVWATICLAAGCVTRPASMPGSESIRYPLVSETRPSGLRTVFEVAPDFGTAGVVLLVKTGSADDPKGKDGLAHLVEHLVVEAPRGKWRLRQRLDALGATWNASTSWDTTTFYAFPPAGGFSTTASLFADILSDPLAAIDEETFQHERQIVRNEMHLRTEPGTMGEALGFLCAGVFPPGHPYARLTVGTEESLDHLTLEDARAFARAHYRPSLSVLATSGPLPIESQRSAAAGFDARPSAAKDVNTMTRAAAQLEAPRPEAAALQTRELPVPTPTLWIGWSIPPATSAEADVAEVASEMTKTAFWIHTDDRDRDIGTVDAGVWPGSMASLFYVQATLKEARDPQATAQSLMRTMQSGIAESTYTVYFPAFKRTVATRLFAQEESIQSRTRNVAESMWLNDTPRFLRARVERLANLGTDRVTDFSRRYLTAERAHLLFLHPPSVSQAVVAEAGVTTPQDKALPRPMTEQEPVPDAADVRSWMRSPGVGGAARERLNNGLEVVVLPVPGSPFHSVLLAYHGGSADEKMPGAAVASLWAKEHFGGSAGTWGVSYRIRMGSDMSTELLQAAGSDLELTLRELENAGEFQILWPPRQFTSRLQVFQREDQSPYNLFDRRMRQAIFGSNPYGHTATSMEISRVRPNDVHGFLDAIRRPENGMLIIVGDFDAKAALALTAAKLGRSGVAGATSALPLIASLQEVAAAPGSGRWIVQPRKGSNNVNLDLHCALSTIDADAYGAASVFSAAADGLFFAELRKQSGASYSPSGHIDLLRNGTTVVEIHADIDYAFLPSALTAIHRFLNQATESWLDDDNLAIARAGAAKSFNLGHGETAALAFGIADMWNRGWPIDTIDRYPDAVLGARRGDVVQLGERCRGNAVVGLMGDEPRIRAAMAAAR